MIRNIAKIATVIIDASSKVKSKVLALVTENINKSIKKKIGFIENIN